MTAVRRGAETTNAIVSAFERDVTVLFDAHFHRIFRVLHRLTGDADMASDLVQEAFVRLFQRGSLPETPAAWLISVAMNLLRNAYSGETRRMQLLTLGAGDESIRETAVAIDDALIVEESKAGVRRTLNAMPARQAQLLLLSAEGYSYRELAVALDLHEGSVGTLLLRAKRAFQLRHEATLDAS
jgi:RNA polymerase sigma factor (sigma-70 family)